MGFNTDLRNKIRKQQKDKHIRLVWAIHVALKNRPGTLTTPPNVRHILHTLAFDGKPRTRTSLGRSRGPWDPLGQQHPHGVA